MNDQFASMILDRAGQQAARLSAASFKASQAAAPARLQKHQTLGN
jgi:hypothetical protein